MILRCDLPRREIRGFFMFCQVTNRGKSKNFYKAPGDNKSILIPRSQAGTTCECLANKSFYFWTIRNSLNFGIKWYIMSIVHIA